MRRPAPCACATQITDVDEMALDTRSTRTVRVGPGAMTVTCPSGHASATADYCDQCGAPIAAVATPLATDRRAARPRGGRDVAIGGARAVPDVRRAALGRRPLLRELRPRLPRPALGEGLGGGGERGPVAVRADAGRRDRVSGRLSRTSLRAGRPTDADRPPARRPARPRRRSTWRALMRIRASPACTPCSNAARTAPMRSATLDRRTARRSTTTRLRWRQDSAVPLADGDRIRIGAWTTITVRSR